MSTFSLVTALPLMIPMADSCSGQGAVMAPMDITATIAVMAVMSVMAIMAVMVVMANDFLDKLDLSERPGVLT